MPYGGTGTAEAAAPDTGERPRYDEAGLGAGYDEDTAALAAEDQLPSRQDARNAAWGDSPEYDEAGLGSEYDGDLGALTAEGQLPSRQDSRNATWGDSPEYDDGDLGAVGDADTYALAAEDQLPSRQDARDATWGDDPSYYDEADLAAEYDGDLGALTAEDQAPAASDGSALDGRKGDQDQAAAEEATGAAGKPGDPAVEAPDASAVAASEQEDGNFTAPVSADAGTSATRSVAETDAGIRPDGAQPDDSHADPEAELKELKAEYEASLKDLKTELQALKDLWQPVPDVPGDAGRDVDQPRAGGLSVDQDNAEAAERQDDRPGLWSNAKYALYGAVGTTVGMALLDQFAPGMSRVVDDIVVGVPTLIGALVPTLREGWKRKHDDSPDKR